LQRLLEDKMLENADAWIYHSVVQQEKKAAGCVEQIRFSHSNILQKCGKNVEKSRKIVLTI